MVEVSRITLSKIIIDVVCLLIVALPILIFYLAGSPFKRGFFCDDDSLRHPFKESTVPSTVLYIFGLGLPIITIVITELLIAKSSRNTLQPVKIASWAVPGWLQECYKHVGVFGFGAATSQLTTDIGKYTIGRLRPHFYDVCKPAVNCSDILNRNKYITEFTCNGTNEKLLKDMRLSFPSGHSSFSVYCMLFLVMYVQSRFTWRGSKLLRHVLQFLALSLSIATALSRISDYKHHWSDVLSGTVLGAIVAIVIVVFVSDLFPSQEYQGLIIAQKTDTSVDTSNNDAVIIQQQQSSL